MRRFSTALVFFMALVSASAHAAGDVLVVFSSSDKITLKDGITHPTGFFLPELMTPVQALVKAGYTPVFANPKGSLPVMDKVSDSAMWFGKGAKAEKEYKEARGQCEKQGLCGKPGTLVGTLKLKSLSEVRKEGLERFVAVFVPGGHAPMEDLWQDKDMGEVLKYFHASGKPTALICHAPIALLSALSDPAGYIQAAIRDDRAAMQEKTKDWIYRDYKVAIFTTREEQQEEPGQDNALGGYVRFYPDESLEKAGAFVTRTNKWLSNVVRDRELITGQNPASHDAMAAMLVKALGEQDTRRASRDRRRG